MTLLASVFPKLPSRKTRLDKCLKARVREARSTDDMGNGRNTGSILMRAPFSHWLMTVKVIELEKSLSEIWNVWRLFVNTLTADYKYSLISKDNLMQTIQMHLSQIQKIFSQFFSAVFKSALNFKHFQKKMNLIVYVFLSLPTTKDVLR